MTEKSFADPTQDLVSIILPVYNAGNQLVDALVSAQEQTHRNIQVICVNDGSTDDSLAIMEIFAAEDERFQVINKENGGYGAAMNDGLKAAQGTWICILEPDDWISSDMLKKMLAFANGFSPKPDIIKCPFWWVPPKDEFGTSEVHCTYKGLIHPTTQPFALGQVPELIAHHPSIWSALYRTGYLRENHICFPEYPGSGWADNRFLAETLAKTNRIVYLDKPFYHYRASSSEVELAFIQKNPLIPFERWQDILRVLEAEGITERSIQQAHARHGFTYLSQAMKAEVLEKPEVIQAVQAMFNAMDEHIVLADPAVSPEQRVLFAQMRGIECIKPNSLAHTAYLAKEALRRVRTNGLRATVNDIKRVVG